MSGPNRTKKKGKTWFGPVLGNAKMRGKPVLAFRCGCCVAFNRKRFPKDADLKKILREEILKTE